MRRAVSGFFGWFSLLMLIFSLLLFAGCGKGAEQTQKREVITGLGVEAIQLRDITDASETSGAVKARNVSVIAAKVMGSVTDVFVRQGDAVKAGQRLLNIDADDLSRAADAALSQKELADVTAARYRRLFAENAVARQQLDEAESRRKLADAEYARAVAYLGFARITSPINGVVTDRRIDPGSMASPGMTLLTVEDTSGFSVETQADERLASRVIVGMPVEVYIASLNRTVTGKVIEASPSVDPVTHTFYVKVEMSDPSLRTGLYAKVRFPLGSRKALTVPAASIVSKGQLTGVYAVDDQGVISYRLVKTGSLMGDQTEVLSGLSAGDRIVVKGVEKAKDGAALGEVKAQ